MCAIRGCYPPTAPAAGAGAGRGMCILMPHRRRARQDLGQRPARLPAWAGRAGSGAYAPPLGPEAARLAPDGVGGESHISINRGLHTTMVRELRSAPAPRRLRTGSRAAAGRSGPITHVAGGLREGGRGGRVGAADGAPRMRGMMPRRRRRPAPQGCGAGQGRPRAPAPGSGRIQTFIDHIYSARGHGQA